MIDRSKALGWLAAGVLAAVPIAAAGCGSSDDNSSSTSASSGASGTSGATGVSGASGASGAGGAAANVPVSGPGGSLKVGESEFKLTPADATTKHGAVKIDVTNDGQVTHSLNVDGPNGDIELGKDLSPGQSGTFTANLPPGTYTWYCPIDGHRAQGMEGKITVQ
jgi:uncharacterized cupredoxin-like copper-binding protein